MCGSYYVFTTLIPVERMCASIVMFTRNENIIVIVKGTDLECGISEVRSGVRSNEGEVSPPLKLSQSLTLVTRPCRALPRIFVHILTSLRLVKPM